MSKCKPDFLNGLFFPSIRNAKIQQIKSREKSENDKANLKPLTYAVHSKLKAAALFQYCDLLLDTRC